MLANFIGDQTFQKSDQNRHHPFLTKQIMPHWVLYAVLSSLKIILLKDITLIKELIM